MLANNNIIRSGVPLLVSVLLFASLVAETTSQPTETHSSAALQWERIENANLYMINLGLELETTRANHVERLNDKQLRQLRWIRRSFLDAGEELQLIREKVLDESRLVEDFKPLVTGTDKATVADFLTNLSKPLDNCARDDLDFWLSITNYRGPQPPEASTGAAANLDDQQLLVQSYAQLRVQLCWQRFVDSIAREIDSQLGKMRVPLFKYIDQVAANMKGWPPDTTEAKLDKHEATKAGASSIRIDDSKAAQTAANRKRLDKLFDPNWTKSSLDSLDRRELVEAIGALKRIKLTNVIDKLEFAKGINRMYKAHVEFVANNDDSEDLAPIRSRYTRVKEAQDFYEDFIERPCLELLDRMLSALSRGNTFGHYVDQTLGAALAMKAQDDMRLAYELQVYRTCKKTKETSRDILNLLLDLNRI